MLKVYALFAILAGVLFSNTTLAADPQFDVSYTWVNELGSTMTFTIASNSSVTGTYVSKVGCEAGKPFPLLGWYNNLAITFTVNWYQCKSLTAWTGHWVTIGGSNQIVTLWYLAISGDQKWNSTVAGTDVFTLQ